MLNYFELSMLYNELHKNHLHSGFEVAELHFNLSKRLLKKGLKLFQLVLPNTNTLIGFCLTYTKEDNFLIIDTLYVQPKYRLKPMTIKFLNDIIDYTDKFTYVSCDVQTAQGANLMKRIGAKPIQIRYLRTK